MAERPKRSRLAGAPLVRDAIVRLTNNGPLLRRLSWPLLRLVPTVVVGRAVLVTRHADVTEVLARDRDFTVAEGNAPAMDRVNGPFILGMDRSPQYLRERALLERCLHNGDLERIRNLLVTTAAELLDRARPTGRIDVVSGLAQPAVIRLVAEYLGVTGPDEGTMRTWMRTIFHEAFLNVGGDLGVRRAGEASGAALHVHLDEVIATRQSQIAAGRAVPDDLLTRLVHLQGDGETRLSAEGVRRTIGGVIVGAVETTSKVTVHAVDQLLRRPDALRRARSAALAGDVDEVGRYAWEAARFNPLNPVLARHAARTTVVAAGTRRQRRIPAGHTVYAGVLPAMFDPAVFPNPGAFRVDRPSPAYLHFGHGLHTCLGRSINLVQVPELVAALLRLDGLRRAPKPEGRVVYDGPFPDRLLVDFDAVSPSPPRPGVP